MLTLLSLPPALLLIGGFVLALGLSYLLTGLIGRLARRRGWLDQPDERRVHVVPVPRLGGVAIFLAFLVIALLIYWPSTAHEAYVYGGFLPAALFITAVMAYDDVRGLPPGTKLALQTAAVLILILPGLLTGSPTEHGMVISSIHNPLRFASLKNTDILLIPMGLALPFTWFWIVGMMNTVNFTDGLDGLAGGIVGIAAVVLTIISLLLHQGTVAILGAIFAGSVLGFLPHNWNPAKIFMGDSGSMFLGLAMAVLSTIGGAKLATVLLLMGLPILDVALVILQRLRGKRGAFHYDKRHLHHKLLENGFSQKQIVLLFYGLSIFFGLLAILSLALPDALPFVFSLSIAGASLVHIVGLALVGLAMIFIVSFLIRRPRPRKAPRAIKQRPSPQGGGTRKS